MLSKPHYPCFAPSPITSHVKGEVDLTARHNFDIIAFCLRYANHFYVATFCRQDGRDCLTSAPCPQQPFQNRTIPCFALSRTASPRKRRWHGCRGFRLAAQYSDSPAFYDSETIPAVTWGLLMP